MRYKAVVRFSKVSSSGVELPDVVCERTVITEANDCNLDDLRFEMILLAYNMGVDFDDTWVSGFELMEVEVNPALEAFEMLPQVPDAVYDELYAELGEEVQ